MTHKFLTFTERHARLLAILLVLIVAFGWYAVRPAMVKAICNSQMNATDKQYKGKGDPLTMTQLRFDYESCLHDHGV
jgi:hypothetical protein